MFPPSILRRWQQRARCTAVLLASLRSVLRASPAREAGEVVWASAGAAGGSRESKHLGQNTPDPWLESGLSGSGQDA